MQTPAISQARSRIASTIGISSTSGGIGNTELSTNEISASIQSAYGAAACAMVQSYRSCSHGMRAAAGLPGQPSGGSARFSTLSLR